MANLVRGAADVGRGLRFVLAHPRLLVWVIAPAVVTFLLLGGVIWGVLALSDPMVGWVAAHLPAWASWVSGVLRIAVVGGMALFGFVVFVSMSGLLAGPFCELLSEAVEERVTGQSGRGFSLTSFLRGLVQGVVHALRRLCVYLFTLLLCFVLGAAIPVVGPAVAIALGGYFAATSAAYDCFDAVLARRLWPYRRKLGFLSTHRGRTLGLGATVAGMMLVPIVNLLALGIGAAGATLAALELEASLRRPC